ncbi:MAG TPA: trypsin-like peptidase domain-containing protein [Usitatibacter sp.]|nr:trypsin-like peptidase domain-containing protein [Usitatibacter sp.]
MASAKKTLYEILGVPRDANEIDIGLAHKKRLAELQRASPPDPGAQVLLHQAMEILADKNRRAAYDASLLTAEEKAAAAEQAAAPDLVLEGGEEEGKPRNKLLLPAVGAVVVLALALVFVLRGHETAPQPSPEPAVAPKPPPPPPPKPLNAAQIMTNASAAVGRVMSYEMSGRAVPVGLALSVEPGAMVTTCHGIPAGSQLVVRVGADNNSATLDVTDEVLDLCRFAVAGFAGKPLAVATDEAKAGDAIFVLGANSSGELALTEGTVKSLKPSADGKVIELSMPVAASGSGGAVFDVYGHLVGIATTKPKEGAGLSIALPASWIAQMRTRNAAK